MVGWLLHVMGVDDVSGRWYGFWSGIGADLPEFALIGGLVQYYRKHTCHVDGCNRLGHLPVEGTAYQTCRRHHPTGGISHGHILRAHRRRDRQA